MMGEEKKKNTPTFFWDLGEIRWKLVWGLWRSAVWVGGWVLEWRTAGEARCCERIVFFSVTESSRCCEYRFVSVSLDQQVDSPRAAMAIFLPTRTPKKNPPPLLWLATRVCISVLGLVGAGCGWIISQSSHRRRVCRITVGKRITRFVFKQVERFILSE